MLSKNGISHNETEPVYRSFWGKLAAVILLLWAITIFLSSYWFVVLIAPALIMLYGILFSAAIIGGVLSIKRFAYKKALGEWADNYYQWGGQQFRIIEKNSTIWVVDEDLINATGIKLDKQLRRKLGISYKGYSAIPGTKFHGFNEAATLEFLKGKQERDPEIIKLKLWFEQQVFFPLRKKQELQRDSGLPTS